MPLLDFWDSKPDTVQNMSLKQIVANAGDGNLKDGSDASVELREYFAQVSIEKLGEYVEFCLSYPFNDSGFVLQDLVNELGNRLEYDVDWGRYRGVKGKVGADGVWRAPEGVDVIVEVKTSDSYRINLDVIAGYRDQLASEEVIGKKSSILLVVGRQDTGDFEAQIRGSKHAWDIRIISADALVKLAELKIASEEDDTLVKIRSLLTPFEYTRLDNIIDIVFTTAADVEKTKDTSFVDQSMENVRAMDKTSPDIIKETRARIISAASKNMQTSLVAKSQALYWSKDKSVRVACTVSKRYDGTHYWYAYHASWDAFLASEMAFMIFGCVDMNVAFVIPIDDFRQQVKYLHTTRRKDGGEYWHIHIHELKDNQFIMKLPKANKDYDLAGYMMAISE
ncbi:MAG: hypothetical protein AB7E51_17965 [Pseudodesulfovibrio sp.]|uniref:hypothetical protein n=1 Tax=Pseudodesulfovibrio sp. TaxID=2035812 RepID=UPI003D0D6CAF